VVGVMTGNPRLSILAIIVLFVAGGALLYFVRENRTESIGNVPADSIGSEGIIEDTQSKEPEN
jgi:hypothetical protein